MENQKYSQVEGKLQQLAQIKLSSLSQQTLLNLEHRLAAADSSLAQLAAAADTTSTPPPTQTATSAICSGRPSRRPQKWRPRVQRPCSSGNARWRNCGGAWPSSSRERLR